MKSEDISMFPKEIRHVYDIVNSAQYTNNDNEFYRHCFQALIEIVRVSNESDTFDLLTQNLKDGLHDESIARQITDDIYC